MPEVECGLVSGADSDGLILTSGLGLGGCGVVGAALWAAAPERAAAVDRPTRERAAAALVVRLLNMKSTPRE